ncbi:hypothetical protein [Cypionkella sinensis]|uniref:Uncharacterized protein n=1 Tax=Cypionkella sinensis TaxID=1756043 RepID=A0ABV7J306_9RHOB
MTKTSSSKTTSVNGGWIKRDQRDGRLVEVQTSKGGAKASTLSASSLSQASSKRSETLKRLADR